VFVVVAAYLYLDTFAPEDGSVPCPQTSGICERGVGPPYHTGRMPIKSVTSMTVFVLPAAAAVSGVSIAMSFLASLWGFAMKNLSLFRQRYSLHKFTGYSFGTACISRLHSFPLPLTMGSWSRSYDGGSSMRTVHCALHRDEAPRTPTRHQGNQTAKTRLRHGQ